MQIKKTIPVMLLAAAIVAAVACVVMVKSRPVELQKQKVASNQSAGQTVQVETREPVSAIQPLAEMPDAASQVEPVQPPDLATPKFAAASTQNPARNRKAKESRQDPLARVAMSFVGADPDAEAYWLGAIYDPQLSNQEREDLMEDLNEEGLSNPRQPGPQDVPLIINRLAIIEEIAPYADSFMLEHLGEAYKDLAGLLNSRAPQ